MGEHPTENGTGEWEPVVTTEEFETGLAILAKRHDRLVPIKKHFYLLQSLVCLKFPNGELRKLTCGMPNANRARGGVAYYCIPSSSINFLCHAIDGQKVVINPEGRILRIDWKPSFTYLQMLSANEGSQNVSNGRRTRSKFFQNENQPERSWFALRRFR